MRLDEMILKANLLHENKGKVYFNSKDGVTYSLEKGFSGGDIKSLWNDGWEELPKRHLTVSEAEKELDCVIDTPDISKLFRSPKEASLSRKNVIAVTLDQCSDHDGNYTGYYSESKGWLIWRPDPFCGVWKECEPLFWIDSEDLIKLLPKE